MTDRRFTDTATLSGTRITADGYLVAEVRCARTGCQTYRASDIGLMGDHAVEVYRPESVVFDRASMATFAGKPVTIGHPAAPITADTWKDHAVGDIGEEVARDGEFIRVPIKLMDAAAIKAVQDGTREISMGYTTPIALRDGVAPDGTAYEAVQTGPIRINHLALVDAARGGAELRIGDGAKEWGGAAPITTTSKRQNDMNVVSEHMQSVVVDGLQVETTAAGAQAITKLTKDRDDAARAHADAITAKDGEIAELTKQGETKDGEIAALKKALEDAASPKAVADAARRRERATRAGREEGMSEEDMEEMDDAAIRRAVVAKRLGDAAKDMTDDAIAGAFAMLSETKPRKDAALGSGIRMADAGNPWAFLDKQKGA